MGSQSRVTNVAVFGLGKLGSPLAAVLASSGYSVIGVDPNPQYVSAINGGRVPVDEPGLQDLLDRYGSQIKATEAAERAVRASEVIFLVVPTPSEPSGAFSTKYVIQAARAIGQAMRVCTGEYKLIVLVSTVMPGQTEKDLIPTLEKESGRKCSDGFGVCYNPEFIALGSVIENMLYPDFILIGESDNRAGSILADMYRVICRKYPPIKRMNLINAEIAKLALNCYVTTKITYANMLSYFCEQFEGADARVVCQAIGNDSRIGHKYLRPGTPYGGPCFPRDNRAFASIGSKGTALPRVTDGLNRHYQERLVEEVTSHVIGGALVAIVGLSYKPDTSVVEESPGIALAQELAWRGIRVIVYDPEAMGEARKVLDSKLVQYGESLASTVRDASVAVITTPWEEFHGISDMPELIDTIVIDPWGIAGAGNSVRHE